MTRENKLKRLRCVHCGHQSGVDDKRGLDAGSDHGTARGCGVVPDAENCILASERRYARLGGIDGVAAKCVRTFEVLPRPP